VTLIIGGMIQNRTDSTKQAVPLLGDIPLLGALFRYYSEVDDNTETVVFLTPRIVSGAEPYLRMRDMEKQPKPLRPVRAEGGKGIKPMK
jgi:type II secretory pathway component GspD/PulD (secretin)